MLILKLKVSLHWSLSINEELKTLNSFIQMKVGFILEKLIDTSFLELVIT